MNEQQTKKQPYIRPALKRIELKVDEVLATNCSNSQISDPSAGCGGLAGCSQS